MVHVDDGPSTFQVVSDATVSRSKIVSYCAEWHIPLISCSPQNPIDIERVFATAVRLHWNASRRHPLKNPRRKCCIQ
jgi:hypothetical protein